MERIESRNLQARSLTPSGAAQLTRQLNRHAAHIDRFEQLIPRSEEVPALLESRAAHARRSGLGDLAFIRPGAVEPGPFYTRRSYEISVLGGYHEVARFMTAIASLPRIVTPMALQMTLASGLDARENARVNAHFRIETYLRPPADPGLGLATDVRTATEDSR